MAVKGRDSGHASNVIKRERGYENYGFERELRSLEEFWNSSGEVKKKKVGSIVKGGV